MVGAPVQFQMCDRGEVLKQIQDWLPSDGAQVAMLGSVLFVYDGRSPMRSPNAGASSLSPPASDEQAQNRALSTTFILAGAYSHQNTSLYMRYDYV